MRIIREFLKYFLFFIFLLILILPNFSAISQEILKENSSHTENCQSVQECEALLEKTREELKKIEGTLDKLGKETKNRQNQINFYRSRIQQLELQIQQGNLMIKDLSYQIEDTETSVEKTSLKIEDLRGKLTGILKAIYEEDQKSLIEILLSENSLSDFFDNLVVLENLNKKNQELLEKIKGLKSNLEKQKEKLDEEKEDLARTIRVQTLKKQKNEEARKEQERILKMTEAQYQQYLKEKRKLEKRAKDIMSRITQLTLPGLVVPSNPKELYKLAKWAGEAAGGVRPALILGLIEEESALGINIGQCNCAGQKICRHPELSYKQVMSRKQWVAFETIVRELKLDLNTTPVSCKVSGKKVQMGGAMGPAQFMPNTWLNLGYKEAVENITGVRPANPWRPSDAFLAAALYLANFGATEQNKQKEFGAAMAYLCGTTNLTSRCRLAGGNEYAKEVMKNAEEWQQWINEGVSF